VSYRCYLVRHASIFPNALSSELRGDVVRRVLSTFRSRICTSSFSRRTPGPPQTHVRGHDGAGATRCDASRPPAAPPKQHLARKPLRPRRRLTHGQPSWGGRTVRTTPHRRPAHPEKGQHTRYTAVLNPQISILRTRYRREGPGDIATSQSACRQPASPVTSWPSRGPRLRMRAWLNRRPPCVCPPLRCGGASPDALPLRRQAAVFGLGRTPQRPPNTLKSSSSHCFPARLGSALVQQQGRGVRCRHDNRDCVGGPSCSHLPDSDGRRRHPASIDAHTGIYPSDDDDPPLRVPSFRIHLISFIVGWQGTARAVWAGPG
jgi:hypothetical protein